ncbi:hypothetical protein Taro_014299 [Colocasia esculenta]|uniref:Uncharacterized protein n=1 Tax=Colocasia esculenta TaxID=4460 RepID=A0A843UEC0_COLES|nr:hypothetical protein [Colocasia esculenta]
MKVNWAANPEANMHTSGSVSFATHQSKLEKELKQPPTFQEVFDKTHKKKGTDQYISDRAREVAESYSQQMTEKYVGEEEQLQLDPEVWVAASGAQKKGHVYGFGHSMDTSRVLSGTLSSASQTSAFTTAGAPGSFIGWRGRRRARGRGFKIFISLLLLLWTFYYYCVVDIFIIVVDILLLLCC